MPGVITRLLPVALLDPLEADQMRGEDGEDCDDWNGQEIPAGLRVPDETAKGVPRTVGPKGGEPFEDAEEDEPADPDDGGHSSPKRSCAYTVNEPSWFSITVIACQPSVNSVVESG